MTSSHRAATHLERVLWFLGSDPSCQLSVQETAHHPFLERITIYVTAYILENSRKRPSCVDDAACTAPALRRNTTHGRYQAFITSASGNGCVELVQGVAVRATLHLFRKQVHSQQHDNTMHLANPCFHLMLHQQYICAVFMMQNGLQEECEVRGRAEQA